MGTYRLNMDCIDVTCLGDTEPKYMYGLYRPVIDTPGALLRYMAKRRWGWFSTAGRRHAHRSACN